MRFNRLLGVLAPAGLMILASAGSALGQVIVRLPGPPQVVIQPPTVYVAPPPPVYVAPPQRVYVAPPQPAYVAPRVYVEPAPQVEFRGRRHGRRMEVGVVAPGVVFVGRAHDEGRGERRGEGRGRGHGRD